MSDLYVTWPEYHQKIEQLALKIYQSQWEFNNIVCIAKGGLRIGDIFARLYDKPLAILMAKSYGGKDHRIQGKIRFSRHLAMLGDRLKGHILLVDDLVDSGISLKESVLLLKQRYPDCIKEIRTAVIWYKAHSIFVPNYYLDYLEDSPWIHQPFEKYEQMNPEQLIQ
jgi:hypoxanthine phosphoribosyltransferase